MSSTQDILNSYVLEAAAAELKSLTENFNNGNISASEYKELLQDISTIGIIIENAAELNAQTELNKIIQIAITIAATAAKAV